jgi:hypothetical protein
MGLTTMADGSAALQGIDPAVVPQWAPQYKDEANAPLTIPMLLGHVQQYRRKNGDKNPSALFMSDAMILEYFQLMDQDVRFSPLNFKGGYTTLDLVTPTGGVKMIQDQYMPENRLVYCQKEDLSYTWQKPLGFLKAPGGGILHRWNREDKQEAIYFGYGEFFTTNRRSLFMISNVGDAEY